MFPPTDFVKGQGAGVKNWIPRTDADYFPSGAQAAYLKHGRQLQCHNRFKIIYLNNDK